MVIGGKSSETGRFLSTVSSHDLPTNTWLVNLPQLNYSRAYAASCLITGYVYVFAGTGYNRLELDSIEKICSSSLASNAPASWALIVVPPDILRPRFSPAVASLNDYEIVIMGGHDGVNNLCDVVLFDTRTNTCQNVVRN